MNVASNLYHEYYRGFYDQRVSSLHTGSSEGHNAVSIKKSLESWTNFKGSDIAPGIQALNSRLQKCATHVIEGYTTGAGFLADTGYAHQTWMDEKDITDPQMGLSLDFSTGVPYLQGSGLKGLLRSRMWPTGRHSQHRNAEDENRRELNQLLAETLGESKLGLDQWNKYLFEGKDPKEGSHRLFPTSWVSYLGACIAEHKEQPLFQLLHLAPQQSPLKKPTPIPYLSVRPGIKMRVYFSFPPCEGAEKAEIEKTLTMMAWHLSESGLGAKQRYGYGRLTDLTIQVL